MASAVLESRCADAAGSAAHVSLYGKWCATSDGPVLPASEHGALARSQGFPDALAPFCKPSELGVARDELEEKKDRLFEGRPHATVLRPVILGKACLLLMYRLGYRPEGGVDQPHSRGYFLGQYHAVSKLHTSPLNLFRAMRPLSGLTPEQGKHIERIWCSSARIPMEGYTSFVLRAVEFLFSGVPLHIDATEREFFTLLDALWWKLPRALRPYLSGGWNVGRSLSGGLAATYAPNPSARCARFDAATGQWREPMERRVVSSGPPPLPNGLPTFPHGIIPDMFIQAGRSREQLDKLLRLGLVLNSGDPAGVEEIPELLTAIGGGRFARHAFRLGWKRLGEERSQALAQDVLEQFHTLDPQAYAAERHKLHHTGPGGDLGHLLVKLLAGTSSEIVEALCDAGRSGEADRLHARFTARLWEALTDSLHTPETMDAHAVLLGQKPAPRAYADWVEKHTIDLALSAVSVSSGFSTIRSVIRYANDLGSRAVLSTLARLSQNQRPESEDGTFLSSLSEERKLRLASGIDARWKLSDTPGREALLDWARMLSPCLFRSPALRLGGWGATFSRSRRCMELRCQSELGSLPAPVRALLSREVIRLWPILRAEVRSDPLLNSHSPTGGVCFGVGGGFLLPVLRRRRRRRC